MGHSLQISFTPVNSESIVHSKSPVCLGRSECTVQLCCTEKTVSLGAGPPTGGEGNSHFKGFGSFDKLEPADWRDSLRTESIGMLAVKTISDCDCYYHCHWLSWTFNRLKLRLPSLLLQVAYIFFFYRNNWIILCTTNFTICYLTSDSFILR